MSELGFGMFDFELTGEQEERAVRLHRESIIVDMLFQGPCGYRAFSDDMNARLKAGWEEHRNPWSTFVEAGELPLRMALRGELPEFQSSWEESGITGANIHVGFLTPEQGGGAPGSPFATSTALFDGFGWVIKALRAEDLRRAKREGQRAGFINTQAPDGLGRDLRALEAAYDEGLRMLQLTYNQMNYIGCGCNERTDAGVSNFGARLIARMNELGMIVDTSHCGRRTTLDACELSTASVVASHTSAEALFKVFRAKSDEELQALAGTGGLIGVYMLPHFLGPPGVRLTIERMLDHVDYIATLVGWQHVGIGTDWPMQLPKWILRDVFRGVTDLLGTVRLQKDDDTANLAGFDDYRDFPNITRGLVKRGYSDEQIKGILGENFLRVFAKVCG